MTNKDKDASVIPVGDYCYQRDVNDPNVVVSVCPYWSEVRPTTCDEAPEGKRRGKCNPGCGHCSYLGQSDDDRGPHSLLWDKVKECGVNKGARRE